MVVDGDRVLLRCVICLWLTLTDTSMAAMFYLACRPDSTLIWSSELTSVATMCCSMHMVLRRASKFSYTPISWKTTTLIRDMIQTKCPHVQITLLWKSTRTIKHLHAVFILGLMTFVFLTLLSTVLTDSRIKCSMIIVSFLEEWEQKLASRGSKQFEIKKLLIKNE